jgi:hypothetical protein
MPMAGNEYQHPEIVVGLVATPPDYPARVAAVLRKELVGRLAERVDAGVRWTVREGWGDVAPRHDGGAEGLLDDLARRRTDDGWDVAICLTDLPLHANRVPLVVQTSAQRRVAMVSLPALGLRQLHALRPVVPILWADYLPMLSTSACRRPVGTCRAGKPGRHGAPVDQRR